MIIIERRRPPLASGARKRWRSWPAVSQTFQPTLTAEAAVVPVAASPAERSDLCRRSVGQREPQRPACECFDQALERPRGMTVVVKHDNVGRRAVAQCESLRWVVDVEACEGVLD